MQRVFVGNDGPLAGKVRDFMLPGAVDGLADLGRWLVVVPTRQAGRRLREELARHCAASQAALLPPMVVTPAYFLRPPAIHGEEAASASLVAAVWAAVLHGLAPGEFPSVFPARPGGGDMAWALHTGATLHRLRETLAEGGLLMRDVPDAAGGELTEPARWRELAALEARYLARLEEVDARDPCAAQILACTNPELPDGVEQILVAGVPDPAPIVIRALAGLGAGAEVRVLIHAPEAQAALFDAWGRPRAEAWASEILDIPDSAERIRLAGTEADQSRVAVALVREMAASAGGGNSVIGVPDRAVVPYLLNELEDAGYRAYHPAPGAVADHRVYRLLRAWRELMLRGDYPALRAVLRHADLARACMPDGGTDAVASVLAQLDQCRSDHLPATLDAVRQRARRLPDRPGRYAALREATESLSAWMDRYAGLSPADAVADFLSRVYAGVALDPARPEDQEFIAVAAEVRAAIAELRDPRIRKLGLPAELMPDLLLQRLRDAPTRPDRGPGDIELEGWLELAWHDAAQVVVTGMNEGLVPESQCADPFLPNRLRTTLGLRSVEDRFARDAFLLRGLIESRRRDGRVVLIAGRSTRNGDVLRPSRLLVRCRDEDLPARAARLFAEPPRHASDAPASITFPLQSAPPPDVNPTVESLHVTAFSDYLACPFRFYLKRVLRMETLDDRKTELDALDFGNLVHAALEQWVRRGAETGSAEVLAGALESMALGWALDRYGSPLPLPVEIQLRAAVQRLGAAARVQEDLTRQGWEPVAKEHRLEAIIGGIRVIGKIDRIDRHRDSGRLRVIDYKTSERAVTPAKAHLAGANREVPVYARIDAGGKPATWINLQLPLYRMLLEAEGHFTGPMELAYFNLPRAVRETGVSPWDTWDDALFESAVQCALGVIADVSARRFWPPAPRVQYDEFAGLFVGDPALCFVPPDAEGAP